MVPMLSAANYRSCSIVHSFVLMDHLPFIHVCERSDFAGVILIYLTSFAMRFTYSFQEPSYLQFPFSE